MRLFSSLICVLLLPAVALAQGSVGGSQVAFSSVGSQSVQSYGSVGSSSYSTTTVSTFTYSQPAAVYVAQDRPRFALFPRLRQRAFASSDCASHLINDHGISRLRVMAMTPWQREQLHNRLHGG